MLVPSTILFFLSDTTPTPWHSLPISLENEVFRVLAKVVWFRNFVSLVASPCFFSIRGCPIGPGGPGGRCGWHTSERDNVSR